MVYRYKTVKRGGKTQLLHRHIAAQLLGRPLSADEHVHHANDVRWDNRPENLKVLPAVEHQRLHADERLVHPREKRCQVCSSAFTPKPTKRKRAKTCSKPCADKLRGNNRRPTPPRMDAAQAREIAAHNAEVDRRKAEKRMRKATGSPR